MKGKILYFSAFNGTFIPLFDEESHVFIMDWARYVVSPEQNVVRRHMEKGRTGHFTANSLHREGVWSIYLYSYRDNIS